MLIESFVRALARLARVVFSPLNWLLPDSAVTWFRIQVWDPLIRPAAEWLALWFSFESRVIFLGAVSLLFPLALIRTAQGIYLYLKRWLPW